MTTGDPTTLAGALADRYGLGPDEAQRTAAACMEEIVRGVTNGGLPGVATCAPDGALIEMAVIVPERIR